ncbi:hypothetical protein ACCD06_27905 [Azospirillum sp. CT11-132]|uniref:hypothetical protein n=1 Tax=Azospirillum sp. CT11-132 TaxID=3396317 RepID=UPI0039A5C204
MNKVDHSATGANLRSVFHGDSAEEERLLELSAFQSRIPAATYQRGPARRNAMTKPSFGGHINLRILNEIDHRTTGYFLTIALAIAV